MLNARRFAYPFLLAVVVLGLIAVPGSADLSSKYQAGQSRAKQLRSQISAQSQRIDGYQGTIDNLQVRLNAIENALGVQERLLSNVTIELTAARTRLTGLRASEARDQQTLAAQLRADYESPLPNIVSVVVDAQGFDQLVNGVRNLTAIRRSNVATVQRVVADRKAVEAQTAELTTVQARRRREAAAILVERDNVTQLRLSIVDKQLQAEHIRGAAAAKLTTLKKTLEHEAAVLDAQAAREQALNGSGGTGVAPPGGCVNTPFVAHGGEWGFFQAPGHQLQRQPEADHRRAPGCAGQVAAPAPDRDLRLPHAPALGRGGRLRRRSPHPGPRLRHAGRRGRPRGHAAAVLPHPPVPGRARSGSHPGVVGRGLKLK